MAQSPEAYPEQEHSRTQAWSWLLVGASLAAIHALAWNGPDTRGTDWDAPMLVLRAVTIMVDLGLFAKTATWIKEVLSKKR